MSGSAGTVTFTYYIDPDCNTKTTDENSGAESEGAALEYDSIKDGTVPLISTIDCNVVSGNKATDVGNNILVIEGTGNYKGEAKATWMLVAKEVTSTPTSGLSKTYGEADPELTYTTSIDSDTPLKDKFDAVRFRCTVVHRHECRPLPHRTRHAGRWQQLRAETGHHSGQL